MTKRRLITYLKTQISITARAAIETRNKSESMSPTQKWKDMWPTELARVSRTLSRRATAYAKILEEIEK